MPGAEDGEGLDPVAEKARLAKEQADHYALRNATLRLELLPTMAVNSAVTAAFGLVRDRMLGLAERVAGPISRLSSPQAVRERLGQAIEAVLVELSEARVIAAGEKAAKDV